MKKVVNILFLIFTLVFYYLTNNENILLFIFSFSLLFIYDSLFSTTSIKNININKIFKYIIISFIPISSILILISYYIGRIINIDNLSVLNIYMTLYIISKVIIKLLGEHLYNLKYKKLGSNLINIYNIINLIHGIILSIVYKVTNISFYKFIIILYLMGVIISIVMIGIIYFYIIRKINDNKDNINISMIKDIFIRDSNLVLYNIIKSSYIYISIIILYYVLLNRYNYTIDNISSVLGYTYLYGMVIMYIMSLCIKKYLNKEYGKLNNNIKNNFNSYINYMLKILLNVCILLMIISGPLCYLLFRNNNNVLFGLIPLLFIYIIYEYIINILFIGKKNKIASVAIIIGIIVKIIFELPLINTFYRMGYDLVLGSITATIIGIFISIIIGYIAIKHKYKVCILNKFEEVLNIIYESIIYCLILVLFTFIIDINNNTYLSSIFSIILYIIITIIFNIVKNYLEKKKV